MKTTMYENRYTPQRLLNRYFIYTWLVAFFLQIGQNLYNNTISVYAQSIGMSATFAGSLALPYCILAIIARMLSGYIVDSLGRRIGMLIGCGVFCLGSFLFGLPALAFPAAMLLARGLHGFGYACGSTSYATAVVDVTPRRNLSMGLGINWTAQGISQALVGVLVILLVRGNDFMLVFIFATAALGCGVLFSALCNYEKKGGAGKPDVQGPREPKEKKSGFLTGMLDKRAIPYALLPLIFYGGIGLVSMFALSLAHQRGYPHGSLFFVVCATGMTLCNVLSVKLAARFGAQKVVVVIFLLAAAAVAAMGNIDSYPLFLVCGLFTGVGLGMMPVIQNETVNRLPKTKMGAGTSTLLLAMDIAMGVGPMIWGAVIDSFGYAVAHNLATGTILCAAVLAIIVLSKKDSLQQNGNM